jgi:hypothetical protein
VKKVEKKEGKKGMEKRSEKNNVSASSKDAFCYVLDT